MNNLAAAQRHYDRMIPECAHVAEREFDKEVAPRFTASSVTDTDVEQFIADLVAAPNKQIFFENRLGLNARDHKLHIAVAQLWVHDVALVHPTIGAVFWSWAKNSTIDSLR